MKKYLVILSLICICIVIGSCEKQQPMLPEANKQELTTNLSKMSGNDFITDPLDWFVVDYSPGEYTFAQFNMDDPDVTVLANGHILLRKRKLSCPISGDIVNSDIRAVQIVISASLNSDINGPAHGTISITGSWEGLTGTFEGRFLGTFSDHLFSGKFNAKGRSGDFLGMRISGTMSENETPDAGNVFIMEGQIY